MNQDAPIGLPSAPRTAGRRLIAPGSWGIHLSALLALAMSAAVASPSATPAADEARFRKEVEPLLKEYCFDCHGDGMNKGKVAFDEFKSHDDLLATKDLWLAVLKNTRAGLMPPEKKPKPSPDQRALLEKWIKSDVFGIDPANPDPGRVTIRRLNRVEYRNTIRDLMGIDFIAEAEFPADDTGHGFDNIGDVLTLSPMLLEKYLDAAKVIVAKAVPTVSGAPAENVITGRSFRPEEGSGGGGKGPTGLSLPYYERAAVSNKVQVAHAGRYQLLVDLTANEKFVDNQFDLNKCRLVFKADGEELLRQDYTREGGRAFHYEFGRQWNSGEHTLTFELDPLTPEEKQVRSLSLRIDSVTVRGPMDEKHYVRPKNYKRFFIQDPPKETKARRAAAREAIGRFARKAFRRPVDAPAVERLAGLAESIYSQPGKTFETGVAQAMTAVLASPRFLFREEEIEATDDRTPANAAVHPLVDEFALASRLSYFLWSSMPDDELFSLAGEKKLRANLTTQFRRMLADPKSDALIRNFTGQWLQGRDIESVPIDYRAVLRRESAPDPETDRARTRFRALRDRDPETLTPEEKDEMARLRQTFFRGFGRFNRFELNGELRRAMRQEMERYFDYVVREDRSLLELLDSDYTFLNKRLAEHYGVTNVEGDDFRRVSLPADSPRGGVLTMGGVLAVTSNPTRTSPVKRGLFILENIFGLPPPPPPPNIPALEDAVKKVDGREPTLRETLAGHREQPLCSSCHNRMDPLGLALENFNALGRWRDKEFNQPIDAAGRLITGESFTNVQQLKRMLASERPDDFYRCVTEKLLTYSLGRGLEHYDVHTIDQLVERLRNTGGRPSALLLGIVESAPFQKSRNPKAPLPVIRSNQPEQRAEIEVQR